MRPLHPDRWSAMFAVALVGKLLILLLLLLEHEVPLDGWWFALSGDSLDYTLPVDNLLAGVGYSPDHRMPGYGPLYFILRLLLSKGPAMQALVILQLFADAGLVVLLARIAIRTTGDLRISMAVFWLALLSTYLTLYDRAILTETFSAFALVLAVHGMTGKKVGMSSTLLITGSALAWLVFLKPVFLPAIALFAAVLLLAPTIGALRSRLRAAVLIAIPFLLLDATWTVRNMVVHHRFQPLTAGVITPQLQREVYHPVMKLMQSYGCNYVWWDASAEIRWFNLRGSGTMAAAERDRQLPLPAYTRTQACPPDSLGHLAAMVQYGLDNPADSANYDRITGYCERCIEAFKKERPFHYHVTSRLRLLKMFVVNSGTAALMGKPMSELHTLKKAMKAGYSVLYLTTMLLGILSAVLVTLDRSTPWLFKLVPLVLLYVVLVFPIAMRMCENRYLTSVYPFALILMVGLVFRVLDRAGRSAGST